MLPKLGAMPVDKVGSAAVYEVLRPIALAGKHATVKMAGKAGTAITAVPEWARIAEFRAEGSPVETVRRRLPKRAGGPKYYDALHFSEVADALARIDATNCAPSTKRAIRFTALTASRQVEVRRATWEQLDLEAAVWVKPAEATKTAKSHRVPLSRQAFDVLAEARKGNRCVDSGRHNRKHAVTMHETRGTGSVVHSAHTVGNGADSRVTSAPQRSPHMFPECSFEPSTRYRSAVCRRT